MPVLIAVYLAGALFFGATARRSRVETALLWPVLAALFLAALVAVAFDIAAEQSQREWPVN